MFVSGILHGSNEVVSTEPVSTGRGRRRGRRKRSLEDFGLQGLQSHRKIKRPQIQTAHVFLVADALMVVKVC